MPCINLVPRLMCMDREKRTWYTLFPHAQFPQDFWEFGNFHKIYSVTLTSARHAYFFHMKDAYHWPALCGRWQGSDEDTQLFACRNCLFIPPKHCSMWLTQFSLWSSLIASNEAKQTVTIRVILFLTSKLLIWVSDPCRVTFQQVNRNWPQFLCSA